MEGAHAQASGMGGMRAAGDLVARMQMTRRMRLKEAKQYVAGKLGCTPRDLSDPIYHYMWAQTALGLPMPPLPPPYFFAGGIFPTWRQRVLASSGVPCAAFSKASVKAFSVPRV